MLLQNGRVDLVIQNGNRQEVGTDAVQIGPEFLPVCPSTLCPFILGYLPSILNLIFLLQKTCKYSYPFQKKKKSAVHCIHLKIKSSGSLFFVFSTIYTPKCLCVKNKKLASSKKLFNTCENACFRHFFLCQTLHWILCAG